MRAEDGRTMQLCRRSSIVGATSSATARSPVYRFGLGCRDRSLPIADVMELELILRAAFFPSIDRAQQRRTPNRGMKFTPWHGPYEGTDVTEIFAVPPTSTRYCPGARSTTAKPEVVIVAITFTKVTASAGLRHAELTCICA
jgi:hypothetical protein